MVMCRCSSEFLRSQGDDARSYCPTLRASVVGRCGRSCCASDPCRRRRFLLSWLPLHHGVLRPRAMKRTVDTLSRHRPPKITADPTMHWASARPTTIAIRLRLPCRPSSNQTVTYVRQRPCKTAGSTLLARLSVVPTTSASVSVAGRTPRGISRARAGEHTVAFQPALRAAAESRNPLRPSKGTHQTKLDGPPPTTSSSEHSAQDRFLAGGTGGAIPTYSKIPRRSAASPKGGRPPLDPKQRARTSGPT